MPGSPTAIARTAANERLRLLLQEARWSGGDLARAVNAVAAETGIVLEYRRASVAQWLAGSRPRPPVPELVAEALSRRLGRPVGRTEAGFAEAVARAGEGALDDLRRLHELGRGPRRELAAQCVYRTAELAVPDWARAVAELVPVPSGGTRTIGGAEITALRSIVHTCSSAERSLGAGHVRPAAVDHLSVTVLPWLSARTSGELVRRELFGLASDLAYLCGFLCFDDELQGAAQRYYRSALDLAAHSGDRGRYARALRAMSVQAHELGHRQAAADLAEVAVATAPEEGRAFHLGQLALARAGLGQREEALRLLGETERCLDRHAGGGTVGIYHRASFAHQSAAVLHRLGDRDGAVTALKTSLRCRPDAEYRSRLMTQATLTEYLLNGGQVEEAAAHWRGFLDGYPLVRSSR
ncbi:hypothetical protein, partial [Crossiella equi]